MSKQQLCCCTQMTKQQTLKQAVLHPMHSSQHRSRQHQQQQHQQLQALLLPAPGLPAMASGTQTCSTSVPWQLRQPLLQAAPAGRQLQS
jgi:hypothetical protein